jgi:hypothetical protein
MAEPSSVDSEGIISFRENQNTSCNDEPSDGCDTDYLDVDSDAGTHLSREITTGNGDTQNVVIQEMSVMMNDVTSVLRDVVLELKDLRKSTLQTNSSNNQPDISNSHTNNIVNTQSYTHVNNNADSRQIRMDSVGNT